MIPTIILHGWSDNSRSFSGLADWLKDRLGPNVVTIFLGDYLSMNDEVTLFDLGRAFDLALQKMNIPQGRHSFDLIVHSTGGLVAREYLRQKCFDPATGRRNAAATPIRHLCMLAPANFGSPLAALGKSILGRVFKGWKWDGFGESGQQVLDALELASPYAFDLAVDDLFDAEFPVFSPAHTLTTVMVGTAAYPGSLKSTLHEDGSDGTVRVATANLQASYFRMNFFDRDGNPSVQEIPSTTGDVALAVFHRNHGSITDPDDPVQQAEWRATLLNALTVTSQTYDAHVKFCRALTEATYAQGLAGKNPEWYHRYQHVVFRVRDQHGNPIDDFMIEFYQEPGDRQDRIFKEINANILEKVTRNQRAANCRSFFFDVSDLKALLERGSKPVVEMSISASHVSRRIRFRNPARGVEVFKAGENRFIRGDQAILVDITLHRDPEVNAKDPEANVFCLEERR